MSKRSVFVIEECARMVQQDRTDHQFLLPDPRDKQAVSGYRIIDKNAESKRQRVISESMYALDPPRDQLKHDGAWSGVILFQLTASTGLEDSSAAALFASGMFPLHVFPLE